MLSYISSGVSNSRLSIVTILICVKGVLANAGVTTDPPGAPMADRLLAIKMNEAKLNEIIIFNNLRTLISSFSFKNF